MAETEKMQFHRPANNDEFKQSKLEKDILVFPLLYGCSNATAYALFHPELCDRNGKLNKAGQRECRMFFSHPNNIAYMDAMRAHLEALTKGTVKTLSADAINDSRKDNALKSLLNQAMSLVEKGEDLDVESLKTISEIFKKVGLLKDEVEQEIRPIRVLPERCGSCRMRIFTESMVSEGKVLDMCQWCKARRCAEEHGYRFNDGKDLLEIPKEVIEELESKNNVRLEDILSGKIEN
jgi:hypothetical protein